MRLKESQIEFIQEDLIQKGITYNELHEDLVDHIATEVEELMSKGVSFAEAYTQVIRKYEKRDLRQLDHEATSILSSMTLFRNFLTSGFRLFKRNFTYSLIRVLGLAVGIMAFLISLIYLRYESSYDGFHEDASSIYRMGRLTDRGKVATTPFVLVPNLRNDYPEYQFTRFFKDRSNTLFSKDDKSFFEDGLIWTDSDFLQFFKFENFRGDVNTALDDPFSIVLTEGMALKYFNSTPELGSVIDFKWNGKVNPLKITGLIPQWPSNMHLHFDAMISFETSNTVFPGGITNDWSMNYCYSYVKLPPGTRAEKFEETFSWFVDKNVGDPEKEFSTYLGFLQPVQNIHFEPEVLAGYTDTINPIYPKIAVGLGLLILLITTINFITLTIAQYHGRTKEIGIRKAIGASKKQVVIQLVLETFSLVMISLMIGLIFIYASIDLINDFLLTELTFPMVYTQWMALIIPSFVALVTLITGLYPAIALSARNVMDTISTMRSNASQSMRRSLLVAQFLIASVLVTCALVIHDQLDFIKHKELGYAKEQVIYAPFARNIRYNPNVFRNKVLQDPGVQNVSLSFYKPTDNVGNQIEVGISGQESVNIAAVSVDEHFFETFGMQFVAGENFPMNKMAAERAFIVNETAVKQLGLRNPLGQEIKATFSTGDPNQPFEHRVGKLIGVVSDFHFESLHSPIKPLIFLVKPYWYYYINIKLQPDNIQESIAHIEKSWDELFPGEPFEYKFLDEEFQRLYQSEQRTAQGLIALVILALLTSCIGLFGYVQYTAQQKTKEVSIRKVLGAELKQIAYIFSREFIWAITLGIFISIPASYYLVTSWLSNFSYRVEIDATAYIYTVVLLFLVVLFTVSKILLQLMRTDPSKTLRYD